MHGLVVLWQREYLFAKGYIKDRTRIKQPKLNLLTDGRDSSFPCRPTPASQCGNLYPDPF